MQIQGIAMGRKQVTRYAVGLILIDVLMFGRIRIDQLLLSSIGWVFSNVFGHTAKVRTVTGRDIQPKSLLSKEDYLAGHRSLRFLPNGNVIVNPLGATYCITPGSAQSMVYIPILFNNSEPNTLQFAIKSLEEQDATPESIRSVKIKQLVKPKRHEIEKALKHQRWYQDDVQDTYTNAEEEADKQISNGEHLTPAANVIRGSVKSGDKASSVPRSINPSQRLYYIPVSEIGLFDLRRVQDSDNYDFRLLSNTNVLITECPSEGYFTDRTSDLIVSGADRTHMRCLGDSDIVDVHVRGAGSLSLEWSLSQRGGSTHRYIVDASGDEADSSTEKQGAIVPIDLKVVQLGHNLASTGRVRSHDIPLPIEHRTAGIFDLNIISVADSLHNIHYPSSKDTQRTYYVQHPAEAWISSSMQKPDGRVIVKENASVTLTIKTKHDSMVQNATTRLDFRPTEGSGLDPWSRQLVVHGNQLDYQVSDPGTYSLHSVEARSCPGRVIGTTEIQVVFVPPPEVKVALSSVHDCAGDVGALATIDFVGVSPFTFHYTRALKGSKTVNQIFKTTKYHDEFEITTEIPGEYTFAFQSISDANYQEVPISIAPFSQRVHPRGAFIFKQSSAHRLIRTCASNRTNVAFTLKGVPPFHLDYSLKSTAGEETHTAVYRSQGEQSLTVEAPESLRSNGGTLTAIFNQLRDGNDCMIDIVEKSASWEVVTTKPTAKFNSVDVIKPLQGVEGTVSTVTVELTGSLPWTVKYRHVEAGQELTKQIHKSPFQLPLHKAGRYQLISVTDRYCTGDITEGYESVKLSYIDRPTIETVSDPRNKGEDKKIVRQAICAGEEDVLGLQFHGKGPFKYRLQHSLAANSGKKELAVKESYTNMGTLHMSSEPGQHLYQITAIADSVYDLPRESSSGHLVSVAQTVHHWPTAAFKNSGVLTYCLNDSLKRKGEKGQIKFVGQAPFSVVLEVTRGVKPSGQRFTKRDIKDHLWTVDIGDFVFGDVGSYAIKILSVSDATGCEWAAIEEDVSPLDILVVEPASVMALSQEQDRCVGDLLEYSLQGTPPWVLTYAWEGKKHRIETSQQKFSRLADQPGTFKVLAISHKKASQCEKKIEDLSHTIHPLPKIHLDDGESWLREGDQTEIRFVLSGSPPFTFTYTRSDWNGKEMAVQDTQTVSDVMEHTYSVYSAKEGEYDVIAVSDRYCGVSKSTAAVMKANNENRKRDNKRLALTG